MTVIVFAVAFLWTLTAVVSLCPFRDRVNDDN